MYEADLNALRKYCAYQERCHQEVQRKARQLRLPESQVSKIIATLIEEGFLNEERFALLWSAGKMRVKQWGPRKIEQGLRQRGISSSLIAKAMHQYTDELVHGHMVELSEKKWRIFQDASTYTKRQKVIRFLIQKGYPYDNVITLVDERYA